MATISGASGSARPRVTGEVLQSMAKRMLERSPLMQAEEKNRCEAHGSSNARCQLG